MLDDPGRVRSKITRLTVDLVSFYYGYIELCMAACPRTVFVGDGHLNLKYPEFKHVTRRHFVIVILEKNTISELCSCDSFSSAVSSKIIIRASSAYPAQFLLYTNAARILNFCDTPGVSESQLIYPSLQYCLLFSFAVLSTVVAGTINQRLGKPYMTPLYRKTLIYQTLEIPT